MDHKIATLNHTSIGGMAMLLTKCGINIKYKLIANDGKIQKFSISSIGEGSEYNGKELLCEIKNGCVHVFTIDEVMSMTFEAETEYHCEMLSGRIKWLYSHTPDEIWLKRREKEKFAEELATYLRENNVVSISHVGRKHEIKSKIRVEYSSIDTGSIIVIIDIERSDYNDDITISYRCSMETNPISESIIADTNGMFAINTANRNIAEAAIDKMFDVRKEVNQYMKANGLK